MTVLQQRAIDMIGRLPDDKMVYVMKFLERLETMPERKVNEQPMNVRQAAYRDLQKYRKASKVKPDYDADLAEALEEKYARFV